MKPIYTFEQATDLNKYHDDITYFHTKINDFQQYLEDYFQLKDIPNGVFWTSRFVMEEVLENQYLLLREMKRSICVLIKITGHNIL
ncbi:hypothetical protein ETI11_01825 [Macrococcoides canis]|uniref:Uncharacterized protein n=1 Tax=Macrococcoides canis TaxID=1855823 RepID=A0A4R6C768_9STAP|nr:hypothetical protein [Macrococcus canis]TDM18209.1 hypothetical protein ETI04_01570 [Macrococcus canis]TDM38160.1 hypothetical protein ETI11_01825 [Macrococcus canis]